ncbi:hypothetical protein M2150_001664 [Lachnospiraceae bacterium PM6-15]|uniref:hypothetical protein n=1 Tax=Ohessyouella blattaphilus TaxID=2949333 RepID=UPI003E29E2F6
MKKIKELVNKVKEGASKVLLKISMIPLACSTYALQVNASSGAVSGINTLVDLAGNIISALGAFVVLWGIFELGNAMQSHDGAQTGQAGKRIAGGLVMVVAPQILKMFV